MWKKKRKEKKLSMHRTASVVSPRQIHTKEFVVRNPEYLDHQNRPRRSRGMDEEMFKASDCL